MKRGAGLAAVVCQLLLPSALLALLVPPAGAQAERPYRVTEQREPCRDYNRLRQPYFGDLHVHTAFSQDASTQGTRNVPRDAYLFARGAELGIQPHDEEGRPLRTLQLARPLDFAAVTDHAELLGEVEICQNPELEGYDSLVCTISRRWPRAAFFIMNTWTTAVRRRFGFCGPDGSLCLEAALTPWQAIRDAAEEAYDRTAACRFTTFVGYEWTGAKSTYNLHRNVIFRNAVVPDLPTSFYEAANGAELRRELVRRCREPDAGCDFLVIPHNSNLSGGHMFTTTRPDGTPLTADDAASLAANEPLVEIMQHKGDSECLLGQGPGRDELCGFEKLPYDGFSGKFVPAVNGPVDPKSFVRSALGAGLVQEERIGVNPFKFGIVASTDTHLGAAGAVSERGHPGHGGAGTPARDGVPPGLPEEVEFNPGGLAVLWAEENSRDSLFAAMRRREAYGTSGPRITVRFFGGWSYPEDLCESGRFVEEGYGQGVPMGADLPPRLPEQGQPTFALAALQDPGTADEPAVPLQRMQIVKGWVGDGVPRERVYEVAGDPRNGAGVDLDTCQPTGSGFDGLCAVWSDPDFDPGERAFYYGRIVENPTCRWSTRVCNDKGVDCAVPSTIGEGLAPCCDPAKPKTIQERAWTSPIWYTPVVSDLERR